MTIPMRATRSLLTVPEAMALKLPTGMSIHGTLAAELALCGDEVSPFMRAMPSREDVREIMPYMWPAELQDLLPRAAKDLLAKQRTSLERDWRAIQTCFPSLDSNEYQYTWFLVGSRGFYNETPETLRHPWVDRLAMVPVADLFNHAETGCSVSFTPDSYMIEADRAYPAGQEICTSYGGHSNDFLLTEYGFLLEKNQWDGVCLDDLILPRLDQKQKKSLEASDRLGNFTLHAVSGPDESTWDVLQILASKDSSRQNGVNGKEHADRSRAGAKALLRVLLDEFMNTVQQVKSAVQVEQAGQVAQRSTLLNRWEQIEVIVRHAIDMH